MGMDTLLFLCAPSAVRYRYSGEGPRALIDPHMTRETWKGGIHQHSDSNGSAISYQNDLDTDKKNTTARTTKAHKAA